MKKTLTQPEPASAMNGPPEVGEDCLPRLAAMAKGLADENRLRILLAVARGRKSVGRVVEEVGLSQPLVSHHLKELRRSGLVGVEREGPFVFYHIAGPQVMAALASLSSLEPEGGR